MISAKVNAHVFSYGFKKLKIQNMFITTTLIIMFYAIFSSNQINISKNISDIQRNSKRKSTLFIQMTNF